MTYDKDKKKERLSNTAQKKTDKLQPKQKKKHLHDRLIHPRPKKAEINEVEYGY